MEKQIIIKSVFKDGEYKFPFIINKGDFNNMDIWLRGKIDVVLWSIDEFTYPTAEIQINDIIKKGFWGDESKVIYNYALSSNLIKNGGKREINLESNILKPGEYEVIVELYECTAEVELYLEKKKTIEEGIELDVGLRSSKILSYNIHLIKKSNVLYALKDFSYIDRKSLDVFKESLSNWIKINHPNIVSISGLSFDPNPYVIMEYVDGGDLRKLLSNTGKLEISKALNIFMDIVKAVNYAHSMNPPIIHRDLKPENILLTSDDIAKVSDWASSCNPTSGAPLVGTTGYIAPESFSKGEYSIKSDVFALGIILYEMLTGDRPFPGMTLDLRGHIKDFPPEIGELISMILRQAPSARPDTNEVLKELEKSLGRGNEVDSS